MPKGGQRTNIFVTFSTWRLNGCPGEPHGRQKTPTDTKRVPKWHQNAQKSHKTLQKGCKKRAPAQQDRKTTSNSFEQIPFSQSGKNKDHLKSSTKNAQQNCKARSPAQQYRKTQTTKSFKPRPWSQSGSQSVSQSAIQSVSQPASQSTHPSADHSLGHYSQVLPNLGLFRLHFTSEVIRGCYSRKQLQKQRNHQWHERLQRFYVCRYTVDRDFKQHWTKESPCAKPMSQETTWSSNSKRRHSRSQKLQMTMQASVQEWRVRHHWNTPIISHIIVLYWASRLETELGVRQGRG